MTDCEGCKHKDGLIADLNEGCCRFHCRTRKSAWISACTFMALFHEQHGEFPPNSAMMEAYKAWNATEQA